MSNDRRVPQWLIERLAHNDLPPAEAERIRGLLRAEPDGEARLGALEASNREILAALPPARIAAEVKRRHEQAARSDAAAVAPRMNSWTWAAGGLAIGAAGFLLVAGGMRAGHLAPAGTGAPESELEIVRPKGQKHPHLAVFRKRGEAPDRLGAGAAVRPGDLLQLAYFSDGRPYGVIVSIDARGSITPHLPQAPGSAARLAPGAETLLPSSFELDNSPGFERFVLVTGDVPFATDVVNEALRPGGAALPAGLSMVDLTLRKETP